MKMGFSLLELLVTLALITLVFTITIPRFLFFNSLIMHNEINKLFVTFTYLQQKAIASNHEQELRLCPHDNSYSYQQNQKTVTTTLAHIVHFGFLKEVKGPPSSPKTPITHPITFKQNAEKKYVVTFFPDGNVSPGTIYVVDRKQKIMNALTCSMAPVSYIRKYNYTDGRWNVF